MSYEGCDACGKDVTNEVRAYLCETCNAKRLERLAAGVVVRSGPLDERRARRFIQDQGLSHLDGNEHAVSALSGLLARERAEAVDACVREEVRGAPYVRRLEVFIEKLVETPNLSGVFFWELLADALDVLGREQTVEGKTIAYLRERARLARDDIFENPQEKGAP